MMKTNHLLKAALFITFVGFCGNGWGQVTTGTGLTAVKKAIENTNTLYFNLFAKKDRSIVTLYTDDASLLAPNAPAISGNKALKKDFEDTFADGKVKGVKFKTSNVYGDSKEYVTEEGSWEVFDTAGKLLDNGKYLKLWRRTNSGWKIFRDSFNSNRKVQQ